MTDATSSADEGPLDAFLTLHAETRGFLLGRPQHATPTPDGRAVLFLRSGPRDPVMSLFEFDVGTGKTRELLSPASLLRGAEEHLTAEEKARRERMRVSTRGFTGYQLSKDGQRLLVSLSGKLYLVARPAPGAPVGPAEELAIAGAVLDPRLSPDGTQVAYVRERDLYVLDLASHQETRLTTTDDPRRSAGVAEFVAQEEMDRFAGYFWAPDSRHLAYQVTDNSAVEEFHLADPTHPDRQPTVFFYPRPGKANAKVSLLVVALPAPGARPEPARPVAWDAAALPYLSQVTWTEGAPLTLVVRSRDQTRLALLAWDAASGSTRTLLEEHDKAWLNIDKTLPRWLPSGSGFLWSSDSDKDAAGEAQLQLRNPQGGLVRVLSAPGTQYQGVRHVSPIGVWFCASGEPTEQHLYRAGYFSAVVGPTRVTTEPGVHDAEFGEGEETFVLRSTTLSSMPRAEVRSRHKILGVLPSVAVEPPEPPRVELVAAGPRRLRAVVVRPRDFDPARRYPVMVDVYGGPHHQSVTAQMGPQLLRQWIADHGYIVVAADGRGTPGRGRAFERALKEAGGHGSFGAVPLDDQVEALTALGGERKEMDLSRVGIYGWSFGGYLAALAVLRRPDVFQVAVAGAPVVDWRDYDTCYTERYLGLPEENRAGYDESSLLTYAGGLARPLLLIHGTTDDNVYFLHSLKLADALFRSGKRFELLPLSGLTHMVPDPLVRRRLYGRILGALGAALRP